MVELVNVTRTFLDLVRGGTAKIPPWDDEHRPVFVICETTAKGDEVLLTAQFRAWRKRVTGQNRKPRKRAARAESTARRAVLDYLLRIARIVNGGAG